MLELPKYAFHVITPSSNVKLVSSGLLGAITILLSAFSIAPLPRSSAVIVVSALTRFGRP